MHEIYKINGNPQGFEDLEVFHKLAQQFLPFAHKKLGFDKPVSVNLLSDPENMKDPLGKTAYYNPDKMEITLFVDKRHVKDILRSLSHELVHHKQNCRGEFDGGINTEPGYAQNDEHMRKCEAEAYLHGSGFLFRDWEDSLKKENQVMLEENKEKLCEDCGKMHEGACGLHEEMDLEESEESLEETQGGYSGQFSDERGDPGTSQTSGQASSSEFEKHGREQQKKTNRHEQRKGSVGESRRMVSITVSVPR